MEAWREAFKDDTGLLFYVLCAVGLGDVDVDFGSGFDGVQLDLLDFGLRAFGVGGALFGQLRSTGANSSVGVVDVVEEDLLGVMAGCRDP